MIIDTVQVNLGLAVNQFVRSLPIDICQKSNYSVSVNAGAEVSTGLGASFKAQGNYAIIFAAVNFNASASGGNIRLRISTQGIPVAGSSPPSGDTVLYTWYGASGDNNESIFVTQPLTAGTTYFVYFSFYNNGSAAVTETITATTNPTSILTWESLSLTMQGNPCIYVFQAVASY